MAELPPLTSPWKSISTVQATRDGRAASRAAPPEHGGSRAWTGWCSAGSTPWSPAHRWQWGHPRSSQAWVALTWRQVSSKHLLWSRAGQVPAAPTMPTKGPGPCKACMSCTRHQSPTRISPSLGVMAWSLHQVQGRL